MNSDETVLQFISTQSEMESKLSGVVYITSDEEPLWTLLRGLREEHSVTSEIIFWDR